jgi:hypothetical protein
MSAFHLPPAMSMAASRPHTSAEHPGDRAKHLVDGGVVDQAGDKHVAGSDRVAWRGGPRRPLFDERVRFGGGAVQTVVGWPAVSHAAASARPMAPSPSTVTEAVV